MRKSWVHKKKRVLLWSTLKSKRKKDKRVKTSSLSMTITAKLLENWVVSNQVEILLDENPGIKTRDA